MSKQKQLFKLRAPNFPNMTPGEDPWGNGCECRGCRDIGIYVATCIDGVARELCENHHDETKYVAKENRRY